MKNEELQIVDSIQVITDPKRAEQLERLLVKMNASGEHNFSWYERPNTGKKGEEIQLVVSAKKLYSYYQFGLASAALYQNIES